MRYCLNGRAAIVAWLLAASLGARLAAQRPAPVFGTYELTVFGRNTMTGAAVIKHYVLVLAESPLPSELLKQLPGTDFMRPDSPAGERACWRELSDSGTSRQSAVGTRSDWRMRGDSVQVVQWFSTDAGTTFLFRTDSAGLRGVALSTGWMPTPPDGRGTPMNLRDSIVGVRVSKPDPTRCVARR